MARSSVQTSLVLLVALISGCGNAGQSSSDAGQPGIADPTATAEPNADHDGDNLSADQDLCPNTPAGVPVDGNGCSLAQREARASNAASEQSSTPSNGASGAGGSSADAKTSGPQAALADGTVTPNGFA
ncbi:MAG TPA: hypothetical protein VGC79_23550, partial [Polyangiaceae bacterium]